MNLHPWLQALAGGVLIGLSAALLLYLNGRIAGISGILNGALARTRGDTAWRVAFSRFLQLLQPGPRTLTIMAFLLPSSGQRDHHSGSHADGHRHGPKWAGSGRKGTAVAS